MNKSFGQLGIRQADVDRARGVEGQRYAQTDRQTPGGWHCRMRLSEVPTHRRLLQMEGRRMAA